MTDGINDNRPVKPVAGPTLQAWPIFLSEMPSC